MGDFNPIERREAERAGPVFKQRICSGHGSLQMRFVAACLPCPVQGLNCGIAVLAQGAKATAMLLGIDTGGTYTDAVLFDEEAGVVAKAKALTTRHDLAIGIAEAIGTVMQAANAKPAAIRLVSLSTTLATNALVEGQKRPVGLVMIGFQENDLERAGLAKALGRDPCLLLPGGHDFAGKALAPLDLTRLREWLGDVKPRVQGFAVASLFSTRNPAHETATHQMILAETGLPVSLSHMLSSGLDGPRRALTAFLNARLIGLVSDLIKATRQHLKAIGVLAPVMVVRGDGALISAELAVERPIETILSGPAATLVGAGYLSGVADALVSDIGGTTTDIALLQGGRPRIDPAGASVGGYRTMVEAVAMTTIGLGGDSEVALKRSGLETRLTLGPRRVMPLALLAHLHREAVLPVLERQIARAIPNELDGLFALHQPAMPGAAGSLSPIESAMFEALTEPVMAVERLCPRRAQVGALRRLVEAGLVLLSGVTPSDACHVLGLQTGWSNAGAQLGLELFARQRNSLGLPSFCSADAAAQAILSRLQRLSAEALIDVAAREDGYAGPPLSQHTMIARQLDSYRGRLTVALDLGSPVIAVGASAGTHYPPVGALLKTPIILPPHADVANAVGAVVGHVRVSEVLTVTEPHEGRFRINGLDAPEIHPSADEAIVAAMAHAQSRVGHKAAKAGAADPEITVLRDERTVEADGLRVFIEAVITATAIGRPRLGERNR
jgi:N-methylhydantoinase A/oxoprolinase/acetone carboxylase beta subunit